MKKFLIILGGLFLLIISVITVTIASAVITSNGLDKESKLFVDENLPKIVSNWDIEAFERYSDQSAQEKAGFTKEVGETLFAEWSKKLGKMVQYKGSKGRTSFFYSTTTKIIRGSYLVNAKFEHGDAVIAVSILKTGDQWKIIGLGVDSPVCDSPAFFGVRALSAV
jgi:hypothetical protein